MANVNVIATKCDQKSPAARDREMNCERHCVCVRHTSSAAPAYTRNFGKLRAGRHIPPAGPITCLTARQQRIYLYVKIKVGKSNYGIRLQKRHGETGECRRKDCLYHYNILGRVFLALHYYACCVTAYRIPTVD